MNEEKYNRIIVIGNNGSGKSYISKKLAKSLKLPLIHLDKVYWGDNWEPTPKEIWIMKQNEFTSNEKWIIDGNHTSTLEIRFKSADLIIFLDINRITCLIGVLKRLGKKKSDMPSNLSERFDREFIKFILGLWNFNKERKPIILELHNKYCDKEFIVIKNRKRMNELIGKLL